MKRMSKKATKEWARMVPATSVARAISLLGEAPSRIMAMVIAIARGSNTMEVSRGYLPQAV
jgi:hypothetical protein